jgi:hypothetical protein
MPISRNEFNEFKDDSWKERIFEFLQYHCDSETPAYNINEIAQELTASSTVQSDIQRKVEWALEDLVNEGKIIKTKIKINDYFYYTID